MFHELNYQPGLDGEPRPGHIVPRPGELAQAPAAGVEAQAGGAGHFAPQAGYLPRQAREKTLNTDISTGGSETEPEWVSESAKTNRTAYYTSNQQYSNQNIDIMHIR